MDRSTSDYLLYTGKIQLCIIAIQDCEKVLSRERFRIWDDLKNHLDALMKEEFTIDAFISQITDMADKLIQLLYDSIGISRYGTESLENHLTRLRQLSKDLDLGLTDFLTLEFGIRAMIEKISISGINSTAINMATILILNALGSTLFSFPIIYQSAKATAKLMTSSDEIKIRIRKPSPIPSSRPSSPSPSSSDDERSPRRINYSPRKFVSSPLCSPSNSGEWRTSPMIHPPPGLNPSPDFQLEEPEEQSPSDEDSSSEEYHDKNYKVQLCNDYQTTGCKHGNKCTYAHGEDELRKRSDKTRRCLAHYTNNSCTLGDKCYQVHSESELRSVPNGDQDAENCLKFAKDGNCSYGLSCRFRHILPTVTVAKIPELPRVLPQLPQKKISPPVQFGSEPPSDARSTVVFRSF